MEVIDLNPLIPEHAFFIEQLGLLTPPPDITCDQWMREHYVLSAESSAKTGSWEPYPFQVGIAEAFTDPSLESVWVMKSARVGWTKIINGVVGYNMHITPCGILVVQPTINDAEGYSKDEIQPMIRDVAALSKLFAGNDARRTRKTSTETILKKPFNGGTLNLVGANSPGGFRRITVRVVLFDEVDGYPATAGNEGDQIELGSKRSETVYDRIIGGGSTPTLEQISKIYKLFLAGDQRLYHVPCPHCNKPQVLKFENLRWEHKKPETAHFVCVHCKREIEYKDQRWMNQEALRRQRDGDQGAGWVATNPTAKNGHASFHVWSAYSHAPNAKWSDIAAKFLDSYKDPEKKKTFVNIWEGQPYADEMVKPDFDRLHSLREDYPRNTIPAKAARLYAGVDIQSNRAEIEIKAIGERMESFSIDFRVLVGSTDDLNAADNVYDQLDEVLREEFPHELGGKIQIHRLGIDTGYNTHVVYNWVQRHKASNRVYALDGEHTSEKMKDFLMGPKKTKVKDAKGNSSGGVDRYIVGTDYLKSMVYTFLKMEIKEDGKIPYGYMHHPMYDIRYFKGLASEEPVNRPHRGGVKRQWIKVYDRNEPFDCAIYAFAVAGLDRIQENNRGAWWKKQFDKCKLENKKKRSLSEKIKSMSDEQ